MTIDELVRLLREARAAARKGGKTRVTCESPRGTDDATSLRTKYVLGEEVLQITSDR